MAYGTHTVTLSVKVDDSAIRPLLVAAKGSKRPLWKHLDTPGFWSAALLLPAWLALTLFDIATGKPLAQWFAELLVAVFWFSALDEQNKRRRAEAILKALNVKVRAS